MPRKSAPELTLDYDNLFYLCATCNGNKSAQLVPDPCAVALGKCVRVSNDGKIHACNRDGRLLIKALRLDNEDYARVRKLILGILKSAYIHDRSSFTEMMRFPDDLPDLKRSRPEGNKRPEGVDRSYHSLRAKGHFPAVY